MSSLCLKVGNLVFKSLDFHRELTPELDYLVNRAVCLLKFVESLQLLLNTDVGIREVLLD